jgi:thymidylate kinase
VRDLCAALESGGVRYCHFKSNAALDRTRSADNDLDLLVARADEDRFAAALHGLGFKQAYKPVGALPGVLDYYGHDEATGRLVHVHAHYQLIVGDDLTKNYVIPLDRAFLEDTLRDGEFVVPSRELELILLVIRLAIKHLAWEPVVLHLGGVPASAREELAFLRARADHDRLHRTLERELPFVRRETLMACLRALEPGAARLDGIRAANRLLAEMAPCARRGRAADVGLKAWRRGVAVGRRVTGTRSPRRRLLAGGSVIALIGADGAGKSTAIGELDRWLGRTFDLTHAHLGRPPASTTTFMLTNLARARGGARRLAGRPRGEGVRTTESAVLGIATARDRMLLARRIRRAAAGGGLVISDRWPLPELKTMDAPRVERTMAPERRPAVRRRLAAIEARYYRAIPRPDVLVVLRVDPEVAVARKPEEPAEFVRRRWDDIWGVDWEAAGAHVVDAGRPREDVLATVRSLVWSEI